MSSNIGKDDVRPGPLRQVVLFRGNLDARDEFPGKKRGKTVLNEILKATKTHLAPTKNEATALVKLGVVDRKRIEKLGFIPFSIFVAHEVSREVEIRYMDLFKTAESDALAVINKEYERLQTVGGDAALIAMFKDLLSASHSVTASSAATSEPSEPSSQHSQDLSSKQATEATKCLVSAVFIGSLCKRKGERVCIHEHSGIEEGKLAEISELTESISQSVNGHMLPKESMYIPVSNQALNKRGLANRTSVREALKDRIMKAQELVESNAIIDLIDQITIEGSSYMETDGFAFPDYLHAKIGVFWNLDLKIPDDKTPDSFAPAVGSFLRDHHYQGDYSIFAFGDLDVDEEKNFKKIASGSKLEVAHVPSLTNVKNTSEKDILSAALTWAWNRLMEFHEPQVVLFMTDDSDILSTVKELKHRDFRVLVLRSKSDKNVKREASLESLWSELIKKMTAVKRSY